MDIFELVDTIEKYCIFTSPITMTIFIVYCIIFCRLFFSLNITFCLLGIKSISHAKIYIQNNAFKM